MDTQVLAGKILDTHIKNFWTPKIPVANLWTPMFRPDRDFGTSKVCVGTGHPKSNPSAVLPKKIKIRLIGPLKLGVART